MKRVLGLLALAGLMFGMPSALAQADGEKLMKQVCMSCHNFDSASRPKTGPNLGGVTGTQAGIQANFTRYSKDMKAISESGLTWTDENLTGYLTDPTGFLREKSGNEKARSTMVFRKLSDEDVAAIIAHMKTLK
jgi:cytochrome c